MGDRHDFSDKRSFRLLTDLGKFEPVPYFSLLRTLTDLLP